MTKPSLSFGRLTLFATVMLFLGGSFTLDRIVAGGPAFDLRVVGVTCLALMIFSWLALASPEVRSVNGTGWFVFVLWVSWLLISSLWAPAGARVGVVAGDLVLLLLAVILARTVVRRCSDSDLGRVWLWLTCAGVVYLLSALLAGPDTQGRYAALGGGPNVFARVMVLAALGAVYLASVRRRSGWLLLVPLFVLGVILSGSRGGLLSLGLVVAVGAVPLLQRLPKGRAGVAIFGSLVTVSMLPIFLLDLLRDYFLPRFVTQTIHQRYDSGRSSIVAGAWDLFVENPVVGGGLDSYYALVGQYQGFEYPHNLLLASAAEAGMIGVLLCAFACGLLFKDALGGLQGAAFAGRGRDGADHRLYCVLGALAILTSSMFSGDYYDSRFLWLFLAMATVSGTPRVRSRDAEQRA